MNKGVQRKIIDLSFEIIFFLDFGIKFESNEALALVFKSNTKFFLELESRKSQVYFIIDMLK